MNTCMVRANFFDENKKVSQYHHHKLWEWHYWLPFVFMLVPFVISCWGFIDSYIMGKKLVKHKDNKKTQIFITYGFTLLLNFFFMLIMVGLYLLDFFTDYDETGQDNTIPIKIRYLSYILTLLTVINPFLIGMVQLSQYFFNWRCCTDSNINENLDELNELLVNEGPAELYKLQEMANQQFLSNIYLTVAYCMERSRMESKDKVRDILANEERKANPSSGGENESTKNEAVKKSTPEKIEYTITNSSINALQDSEIQSDEIVKSQKHLKIKCEEYAPIIFRCLREIDGIDEDLVIKSCLHALNK